MHDTEPMRLVDARGDLSGNPKRLTRREGALASEPGRERLAVHELHRQKTERPCPCRFVREEIEHAAHVRVRDRASAQYFAAEARVSLGPQRSVGADGLERHVRAQFAIVCIEHVTHAAARDGSRDLEPARQNGSGDEWGSDRRRNEGRHLEEIVRDDVLRQIRVRGARLLHLRI